MEREDMMAHKLNKPLLSPKGDTIENFNWGKQLDTLIVVTDVLVKIVNLVFVPLRVREVYMTDGLSRRFAHYAMGAFLLLVCYARMHNIIGSRLVMVLLLPAMIGFLVTYADLFTVCIYMLVSIIIMLSVMMIFYKN